jgi:hypothetical protein
MTASLRILSETTLGTNRYRIVTAARTAPPNRTHRDDHGDVPSPTDL